MSKKLILAPLIDSAIKHEASDVFFSEGVVARLKINGALHEVGESPVGRDAVEELWAACGQDPEQVMDADSAYVTPDGTRFRVNFFRHTGRLGAVLRQIKSQIPNMEALELPQGLLTTWMQAPSGLVLVTGPSGCGKSTTLASCLEWINHNLGVHVVTIEDPIEYLFEDQRSLFSQREVYHDTPSFAEGLRRSLRQAPDVIFLGEIRDPDSAKIALQAAETGHLVLSTLHSSGVVDTLDRLLNLFPHDERKSLLMLLSAQLIGVFSQMLLPKPDASGLRVVVEHLNNEGATRLWIREGRVEEVHDFLGKADDEWNRSFMTSLVDAARSNEIDTDAARRAASNSTEFDRALRGIS
jgi:pilus retraction protein PilT